MILVVAEQKDGKLNRASWEAIAGAQQLAQIAGTSDVGVVVAGKNISGVASELAAAELSGVTTLDHEALGTYTADAFSAVMRQAIDAAKPTHVVFAHTYQTRDFAPSLAAAIDRPIITDVIGVKASTAGPAFSRPMFQGKLTADVVPEGATPHLISFQIGAFRADSVKRGSAAAPVTAGSVDIDTAKIRQSPEAPFQEAKQAVDLSQAERIVAVGRGIKAHENLPIAEKLAKAFGAELAASRPICDNGWLPMERQIGSSGQTVAPKLYVALGISGAIQHLVGMKGARTIVAINKDAEAPIFEVADYGINGDIFEIAPALVAELEKG